MNLDELDRVKSALERRVNESHVWASSKFSGWKSPAIDALGQHFSVNPVQLLENPDIKQGDGIRFEVRWDDGKRSNLAYLEVRLSPAWKPSETRKGNGNWQGPLIKCRAAGLRHDPAKVSSLDDVLAPNITMAGVFEGESIDEFYVKWIRKAFEHERIRKVIDYGESRPG